MLLHELCQDVQDPELLMCVQEAIEELSPRQRQVLLLTLQGYCQREVAERLGISRTATLTYLRRARGKLRAAL